MRCLRLLISILCLTHLLTAQVIDFDTQKKISAAQKASLQSQQDFQQLFIAMQTQAFSNHLTMQEFKARPLDATKTWDQASAQSLMTTINQNANSIAFAFSNAGVFANLAEFSLKTAIGFPGFQGFANKAGLISQIATAGAGVYGLIAAAKNNSQNANLSAALAALVSGVGSYAGKQGQSGTLGDAFAALNKATQDVAILEYLQQDYNVVGPPRENIQEASELLARETADIKSITSPSDEAKRYVDLIKSLEAFYDVTLVSLKTAINTQKPSAECDNPATMVSQPQPGGVPLDDDTQKNFCKLIRAIDKAEQDFKPMRASFDNAATQAQAYLVTLASQ